MNFISSKTTLVIAGFLAGGCRSIRLGLKRQPFPSPRYWLLWRGVKWCGDYKRLASLTPIDPNMHALMSIAVTGACLIGQWPEAAMVMVLFNIAEFLEGKSLERAQCYSGTDDADTGTSVSTTIRRQLENTVYKHSERQSGHSR